MEDFILFCMEDFEIFHVEEEVFCADNVDVNLMIDFEMNYKDEFYFICWLLLLMPLSS